MKGRFPLACLVLVTALTAALLLSPASASASVVCTTAATDPCASLSITKYGPYVVNSGDTADFTYYVYNTGYEAISDITVTDDQCSPVTGPTNTEDTVLMPYTSPDYPYWVFTCSYDISGDPGSFVDNVATVHGLSPSESDVSATSNTHRTYINGLQVTKTVDLTSADPFDELHYTIKVENIGSDPQGPSYYGWLQDNGCVDLTQVDPGTDGFGYSLDPGESVTYTCHHNFNPGSGEGQDSDPYVNEACAYAYANNPQVEGVSTQEAKFDIVSCDDASTALAKHSVSGQVFEDMNADGARQLGEPALPGIVIYADLNGNGTRDEGEPSSTSDGQGNWSLPVDLGTTTIRQDTTSPFTCSFPSGCAYTVDLPKNAPPPPPDVLSRVLAKADDPTGKDFGDWRPATVSGTVVDDVNGNGARDAGENGLAGVPVYADLNDNGTLDAGEPTVNSGGDGAYAITGLKPGGYVIRQVLPEGRTCSAPANGCTHSVTLVSNGSETNRDFLDVPQATQAVLGARIIPGVARMTGKTGCVTTKGFFARIRGRQMNRVVFYLDGKAIKSFVLPKNNRTYRVRINVSKLSLGAHTVAARVTFRSGSGTKSKTVRLTFQRCAPHLRAPKFTG